MTEGVQSSVTRAANFTEQADAVVARRARCGDPVTDSSQEQEQACVSNSHSPVQTSQAALRDLKFNKNKRNMSFSYRTATSP